MTGFLYSLAWIGILALIVEVGLEIDEEERK